MGFILESAQDNSVNFVTEVIKGKIECRYVRRNAEKVNCYLSSQTGCKQACRMCFLTQTGQTDARDISVGEYIEQARTVLQYYDQQVALGEVAAYKVHYDFMARGDVFANNSFLDNAHHVFEGLAELANKRHLIPLFKLSTIMPKNVEEVDLAQIFGQYNPDIYYSLYSVKPEFRKRWLSKAQDPRAALRQLKAYQDLSHKVIFLHWAFIKGQNDDVSDVVDICEMLDDFQLRVNINIVRYNPYSEHFGEETDEKEIKHLLAIMKKHLPRHTRFKVVDRVGFDVNASCGMFVS